MLLKTWRSCLPLQQWLYWEKHVWSFVWLLSASSYPFMLCSVFQGREVGKLHFTDSLAHMVLLVGSINGKQCRRLDWEAGGKVDIFLPVLSFAGSLNSDNCLGWMQAPGLLSDNVVQQLCQGGVSHHPHQHGVQVGWLQQQQWQKPSELLQHQWKWEFQASCNGGDSSGSNASGRCSVALVLKFLWTSSIFIPPFSLSFSLEQHLAATSIFPLLLL